jgi:hypothetical protein
MATTTPRRLKVFLCHAVDDKPSIRRMHAWLLSEGYDPWMDEESLIGGDVWAVAIREALKSADIAIVCLSDQSVTKTGFVQKEIAIALDLAEYRPEGQPYVVPIRLEPCRIPDRLARWHAIDLTKTNGWQKLLQTLDREAKRHGALVVPHIARAWARVAGATDDTVLDADIEGTYELDDSRDTEIIVRRLLDDRFEIVRRDYSCIGVFHGTTYLGAYHNLAAGEWGIMRGTLYKRGQLVVHFSRPDTAESLRDEIWLCTIPGPVSADTASRDSSQYPQSLSYLIGDNPADPLTIISLGRGLFLPQTSYYRGAGLFDGRYYLGVYRYTHGVENINWGLRSNAKWMDVWGRHEGHVQDRDVIAIHGKDLIGIDNWFATTWHPKGQPMVAA